MPAATGEPNPILLFLFLFVLVLGVIGLMGLVSRTKVWLRGESFWPLERFPRFQGVNHSQAVMSPAPSQTTPDQQTDSQTDHVSAADQWLDRIEVDRTRTAIIELMVYSGWATGEIRSILKGDNNVLGPEIEAAKKKLGIVDEPRQLRVRDEKGERLIPMEVP